MEYRAEKKTEIVAAVSKLLQTSESLSLVVILEMLATAAKAEVAIYWTVDPAAKILRQAWSWYSPGSRIKDLRKDLPGRSFTLGEGMPGKVWKFREIHYSNDLAMDMSLPRSLNANQAGLRAGLWIPVETPEGISGVVELLREQPIADIDETLEAFKPFSSRAPA